ncbi:unnamed protein product [Toxocara canis]|uniref:Uncharacterized protein n=1 Tax=Toxocara canis TaxID=6265 RepID=A0A183UZF1_TOXCA|nr:unnamed protein product [Toxocara canis]
MAFVLGRYTTPAQLRGWRGSRIPRAARFSDELLLFESCLRPLGLPFFVCGFDLCDNLVTAPASSLKELGPELLAIHNPAHFPILMSTMNLLLLRFQYPRLTNFQTVAFPF